MPADKDSGQDSASYSDDISARDAVGFPLPDSNPTDDSAGGSDASQTGWRDAVQPDSLESIELIEDGLDGVIDTELAVSAAAGGTPRRVKFSFLDHEQRQVDAEGVLGDDGKFSAVLPSLPLPGRYAIYATAFYENKEVVSGSSVLKIKDLEVDFDRGYREQYPLVDDVGNMRYNLWEAIQQDPAFAELPDFERISRYHATLGERVYHTADSKRFLKEPIFILIGKSIGEDGTESHCIIYTIHNPQVNTMADSIYQNMGTPVMEFLRVSPETIRGIIHLVNP